MEPSRAVLATGPPASFAAQFPGFVSFKGVDPRGEMRGAMDPGDGKRNPMAAVRFS